MVKPNEDFAESVTSYLLFKNKMVNYKQEYTDLKKLKNDLGRYEYIKLNFDLDNEGY